jgi:hypothetical protein
VTSGEWLVKTKAKATARSFVAESAPQDDSKNNRKGEKQVPRRHPATPAGWARDDTLKQLQGPQNFAPFLNLRCRGSAGEKVCATKPVNSGQ